MRSVPTFITLKSGRSQNLARKVAVSPQVSGNICQIPPLTKCDYWSLNLVDHIHVVILDGDHHGAPEFERIETGTLPEPSVSFGDSQTGKKNSVGDR